MNGNGANKKYLVMIIFLIVVCISLSFFCIKKLNELPLINEKLNEQEQLLKDLSMIDGISPIDSIYIYGIHLNLSGKVEIVQDVKSLELIFYDGMDKQKYKLLYEIDSNYIKYRLSDYINDGINLNDLEIGNYKLLLKVTTDTSIKYYSLYNTTSYDSMDYYSVTKNGKNNYITILSNSSNINAKIIEKKLPDDVYDIVIDPGHGGEDSGAVKNGVYEEKINLQVALKLKEKLESLGLKVKLTREGNYNPGNLPGITAYGAGGRIDIGYETKSKLFLSVHSNSTSPSSVRGLEVYTSSKNNKELASLIADEVTKTTGIIYSNKTETKVKDGVYVRNFTYSEIEGYKKSASKDGYTFYESVTTKTPFYYVIRETGGIVTGAYVDGRNKKKELNEYRNSNVALDGYLIELGYITNSSDVKILLDKKEEYSIGISNAVKKYLNITN